jgi:hypothetical protein
MFNQTSSGPVSAFGIAKMSIRRSLIVASICLAIRGMNDFQDAAEAGPRSSSDRGRYEVRYIEDTLTMYWGVGEDLLLGKSGRDKGPQPRVVEGLVLSSQLGYVYVIVGQITFSVIITFRWCKPHGRTDAGNVVRPRSLQTK